MIGQYSIIKVPNQNFNFSSYLFQMTSLNRNLESIKSEPIMIDFAKDSVLTPITNLHEVSSTSNVVTIAWDHSVLKGSGYRIVYRPDYITERFALVTNTSESSITGEMINN